MVTSLNIAGNKIDEAGLVVLGAAIKAGSALKTIDVRRNPLGDEGAAAIARMLEGGK